MIKIIIGAMLTIGLLLSANTASLAGPGDGLNRNAAATGNSNMGGMHRGARGGGMRHRMGGMRMMRHHHRRHR